MHVYNGMTDLICALDSLLQSQDMSCFLVFEREDLQGYCAWSIGERGI